MCTHKKVGEIHGPNRFFGFVRHTTIVTEVLRLLLTPHSFSVTLFTLGFRLFFYSAANKQPERQWVAKLHTT
jgi:hypothetical protein